MNSQWWCSSLGVCLSLSIQPCEWTADWSTACFDLASHFSLQINFIHTICDPNLQPIYVSRDTERLSSKNMSNKSLLSESKLKSGCFICMHKLHFPGHIGYTSTSDGGERPFERITAPLLCAHLPDLDYSFQFIIGSSRVITRSLWHLWNDSTVKESKLHSLPAARV